MAKYKIYSKAGCIFCDAAMELLKEENIEYEEIKVTENEQAQKLFKERKFRTVPQIFDDKGKHIGGFHDLRSTIHWPDNPVECGKIG